MEGADIDEWDRDDLQAYFEKFVLTDGTITDEDRDKLRNKIKFLAKASTSDFHRPMRDCYVERRVNEAAADLACHRTQKLEDSIVKRSEDQTFFIPQLNIEVAMKKLAMMGDGKTEREKLQAVEARRRAMGSRGSQGAPRRPRTTAHVAHRGRPERRLRPAVADLPRPEGEEGSRPGSRAPAPVRGSRPVSRAPSRLAAAVAGGFDHDEIRQRSPHRLLVRRAGDARREEQHACPPFTPRRFAGDLAPGISDVADLRLEGRAAHQGRRPGTGRGACRSCAPPRRMRIASAVARSTLAAIQSLIPLFPALVPGSRLPVPMAQTAVGDDDLDLSTTAENRHYVRSRSAHSANTA